MSRLMLISKGRKNKRNFTSARTHASIKCNRRSLFVEVLATAGIDHLLHDLLVSLVLECASVALLFSLLVCCPVDSLVALEQRANLFINLLFLRLPPVGRPSVHLLMLGSVSGRSSDITSSGRALSQRVSPCTKLR